MCNLSDWIEEKGIEKATKKVNNRVILNMYKQGYTLDQIASVVEVSPEQVEKMLSKICHGLTNLQQIVKSDAARQCLDGCNSANRISSLENKQEPGWQMSRPGSCFCPCVIQSHLHDQVVYNHTYCCWNEKEALYEEKIYQGFF